MTKIDWVINKDGSQGKTLNVVTGCTKISAGCKHCYAERMAHRLKSMGQPRYKNGFEVTLHWDKIDEPKARKKPTTYFINSMGDLFHKDVPYEFIIKVFAMMRDCPQHIFIVLTKRSERLAEFNYLINRLTKWPPNVWMGVSIESLDYAYRIGNLCSTSAEVKFISFEPLIGRFYDEESQQLMDTIYQDTKGIDWIIAGGENGSGAREMKPDWVKSTLMLASVHDIPFFFKGWGAASGRKKSDRDYYLLEGQIWKQMPKVFYNG